MSKSREKGTRFETKILRRLEHAGFKARRMPAGARYDVEVDEPADAVLGKLPPLERVRALVTEPDYGQTLVIVDFNDFLGLLHYSGLGARIECKKWRAFPHHTLWQKEME